MMIMNYTSETVSCHLNEMLSFIREAVAMVSLHSNKTLFKTKLGVIFIQTTTATILCLDAVSSDFRIRIPLYPREFLVFLRDCLDFLCRDLKEPNRN